MLDAKEAYCQWRDSHKINLRVYTDEEMFVLGYNQSQALVRELASLVEELDLELKNAKAKLPKANKAK